MTETERKRDIARLLGHLAEELDVPDSKYEEAKKRYDAVGTWLKEEGSELAPYDPIIYPQGSFAFGTAIRPIGEEEYDVDVVCLLSTIKSQTTQQTIKEMVGKRLKAHKTYLGMLDPKDGGRRCWTLKYSDSSRFHLDILPAIPDDPQWLAAMGIPKEFAQYSICITDKNNWATSTDWPKSNPKGYAEWFKQRMREIYEKRRRLIAEAKRAEIEDIPEYQVRTPLQSVIQLLKRHRDIRFNGDDDKPISIIITTLAALAYSNEADIVDAFLNINGGMRRFIDNRNGTLWVPNPVNPLENFADKWGESRRKADLFFNWLDSLERENRTLLVERDMQKTSEYLSQAYGQRDASAAVTKYASEMKGGGAAIAASTGSRLPSRFDVSHREPASEKWPIDLRYVVRISARASRDGFRTFTFGSESQRLQKHFSLRFEVSTNVPEPFDVYWQVVNTGEDAARANGLRGSIFAGNLVRVESTLYRGFHWIECFIVKGNRCVARSGEFIVSIE